MKDKLAFYFVIYIIIPAIALNFASKVYAPLSNSSFSLFTMIYLLALFVISIIDLYVKQKSLSVFFSSITTAAYLQILFSDVSLQNMGISIDVNMQNLLYLVYILLGLKIGVAVYYDVKQKSLFSTTINGKQWMRETG